MTHWYHLECLLSKNTCTLINQSVLYSTLQERNFHWILNCAILLTANSLNSNSAYYYILRNLSMIAYVFEIQKSKFRQYSIPWYWPIWIFLSCRVSWHKTNWLASLMSASRVPKRKIPLTNGFTLGKQPCESWCLIINATLFLSCISSIKIYGLAWAMLFRLKAVSQMLPLSKLLLECLLGPYGL